MLKGLKFDKSKWIYLMPLVNYILLIVIGTLGTNVHMKHTKHIFFRNDFQRFFFQVKAIK